MKRKLVKYQALAIIIFVMAVVAIVAVVVVSTSGGKQTTGDIEIIVQDAGGNLVNDVTVYIAGEIEHYPEAGFVDVPVGDWRLVVLHEEYRTVDTEVSVVAGENPPVKVILEKGTDTALSPTNPEIYGGKLFPIEITVSNVGTSADTFVVSLGGQYFSLASVNPGEQNISSGEAKSFILWLIASEMDAITVTTATVNVEAMGSGESTSFSFDLAIKPWPYQQLH